MFKILLVDQTMRLLTASEEFWRGSGYIVQFTRARTMQASIECAIKNVYWYIDINADSMDYLPQLPVLRRSSNAPIVALATEKNRQKEIAAYDAGWMSTRLGRSSVSKPQNPLLHSWAAFQGGQPLPLLRRRARLRTTTSFCPWTIAAALCGARKSP